MRRTTTALIVMALAMSACTETSDRVTTPPEVPVSLAPGSNDVGAGACSLTIGDGLGARVADVVPGSPADGSLLVDDVITAIDGSPILTAADVVAAVGGASVGSQIDVSYERAGSPGSTLITLGETPDAPGRPRLGILVVTDEMRLMARDAAVGTPVEDLARIVSIDGSLFGFDPESLGWTSLGVPAPSGGWIPIGGDVYWIATEIDGGTASAILSSITPAAAPLDIGDWTAQVSLTSIGGKLLLGADRVNPDTGVYEAGVLAIDPATGKTAWAWVAEVDDGAVLFPTFAFKEPDAERVLLVLTPPDDPTTAAYVLISEPDGQPVATLPAGLPSNAVVIGWHDRERLISVLGSISEAAVTNPDTGATDLITLPLDEVPDGLWPIGDGQHLLVDRGVLELVEIGGVTRRTVASSCTDFVVGELGFVRPGVGR